MWTTLNFEGRSKTKNRAEYIYKGNLAIECKRDWSVSLGATLDDGQKIKNKFSSFKDFFSRKADSAIWLGFECTIDPQNFMKIVGAIFEKIKILNFFLMWLPLILRVDHKRKQRARDICNGTLVIEFERDWSVGLGATLGDGLKIKNYFPSFWDFSG